MKEEFTKKIRILEVKEKFTFDEVVVFTEEFNNEMREFLKLIGQLKIEFRV